MLRTGKLLIESRLLENVVRNFKHTPQAGSLKHWLHTVAHVTGRATGCTMGRATGRATGRAMGKATGRDGPGDEMRHKRI